MFRSICEQFGQSSDSQTSSGVFESDLTRQKSSRSSFAGSTETNIEVGSDNSLVAPPPSFVSGVQSTQRLPSMALNMTPELHSPTPPTHRTSQQSLKTYPFLDTFTGEIEDFPVWLPCVRPFVQWQKK
ncbi:hypothetical protein M3Y98_00996700 [Aphelenchoides besseyi]|nr:hypothetical protein M3Y98_00996700 [Aphelenchoides besseyi]